MNIASRRFQALFPSNAQLSLSLLSALSPTSSKSLLHSTYHTSSYINQSLQNDNSNKKKTTIVESYTERQAKKGRFVSPHLTIYKFPIAALSSITNRVTGVLLTVGMKIIYMMLVMIWSYFVILSSVLYNKHVCLNFWIKLSYIHHHH